MLPFKILKMSKSFQKMRKNITMEFVNLWKQAYKGYIHGNWKASRDLIH